MWGREKEEESMHRILHKLHGLMCLGFRGLGFRVLGFRALGV